MFMYQHGSPFSLIMLSAPDTTNFFYASRHLSTNFKNVRLWLTKCGKNRRLVLSKHGKYAYTPVS